MVTLTDLRTTADTLDHLRTGMFANGNRELEDVIRLVRTMINYKAQDSLRRPSRIVGLADLTGIEGWAWDIALSQHAGREVAIEDLLTTARSLMRVPAADEPFTLDEDD